MSLFKKKKLLTVTDFKCPAPGCLFTCDDAVTLKKHSDWKHPELSKSAYIK